MVIILNSYDIVKEAFVGKGNDCSDRPDLPLFMSTYNPHYPHVKGKKSYLFMPYYRIVINSNI